MTDEHNAKVADAEAAAAKTTEEHEAATKKAAEEHKTAMENLLKEHEADASKMTEERKDNVVRDCLRSGYGCGCAKCHKQCR